MTLEEAIEHCEEKAQGCDKCSQEHKQLKEWLTELKERRAKERAEKDRTLEAQVVIMSELREMLKSFEEKYIYIGDSSACFVQGDNELILRILKEIINHIEAIEGRQVEHQHERDAK